jgi:ABC-type Zn uptake system ZnuABC Zn-binding protein ZnuA
MFVEMGDYVWSEYIFTVFLASQITMKNVQVQLTVKGKTTPDSYTPTPKSSCAQNMVVLK